MVKKLLKRKIKINDGELKYGFKINDGELMLDHLGGKKVDGFILEITVEELQFLDKKLKGYLIIPIKLEYD